MPSKKGYIHSKAYLEEFNVRIVQTFLYELKIAFMENPQIYR